MSQMSQPESEPCKLDNDGFCDCETTANGMICENQPLIIKCKQGHHRITSYKKFKNDDTCSICYAKNPQKG